MSIVRYERQGLAGSSSSFGEEVTRHPRQWGFYDKGQFLSLRSTLYTTSRWIRRPFRLDATVLLENKVLPRPMSNEVSFPSSSLCSVLFFPGSFPTNLLRPFFVTLWWWFYKFWECSFTARTLSLLILEVQTATCPSFQLLLRPKGPFLVMLTRQKSMDLASKGLFLL